MQPFVIVISQIFLQSAIDFSDIGVDLVDAFFLKRPVEPFDVRIVVRFADPGIPMILPDERHEALPEFRSVVALKHLKLERSACLRFLYKLHEQLGTHSLNASRICPPRIYVDEHKDIYPRLLVDHEMNGIHLDQIAWFKGFWTLHGRMPAFQVRTFLQKPMPVEGALHGGQRYVDSLIEKFSMYHLCTSFCREPLLKYLPDQIVAQLLRMTMRS